MTEHMSDSEDEAIRRALVFTLQLPNGKLGPLTAQAFERALEQDGFTVRAREDAAPRQPEPETVWTREREQLAAGGHRIAGPATQTQDGRWGEAEEACQHGRSAHNDKGCRDCACKVTYEGGLATPNTTTEADR